MEVPKDRPSILPHDFGWMDDFGDKLMLKTQKLLTDIKDIVESHDRPLPEETLYITTVHKGVSNVSLNVASALSFHHFLYHSSIPALRKREKIAYMQSSPAQAMFTCGYYVMYHGFLCRPHHLSVRLHQGHNWVEHHTYIRHRSKSIIFMCRVRQRYLLHF